MVVLSAFGGMMMVVGLYFLISPAGGIQIISKTKVSNLDKKLLREGVRDQPRIASCTARVVGFVFIIVGGLIVYAVRQ